MQVILLKDIPNLGKLGEIIKVKNGYARNFLIPKNKARHATKFVIKEFEEKRIKLEKTAFTIFLNAKKIGEEIKKLNINIIKKSGVDGKLFGSVTNSDIVKELEKKGLKIEKNKIKLPNNSIKKIGNYYIDILLHSKLKINKMISVSSEIKT
ncbi:50S ribosomal protein L9 [Candidatus Profftella armatura]|uniref:Large ribosomal subunit protein bL9 n=1 Tax=Candidatus Profftella armatura TaxID=669502 RepID=S5R8M9_9PROT|nr:50S ribosomal protein L9 [Candidatus Profftella armatura]AGS06945.1 50S ribosomal protein L9 [Candidatus Profftella armatura]ALC96021.1 50S ribosomal protein L9 [Candidatus Profftella armatura]QLK13849.1 50S ribosomal protein L9 [Candidatus Profftella armatura]